MSFVCALCGKPIEADEIRRSTIAKQVTGWHILRGGGGQNALFRRKETGAIAHVMCVRYGPTASPVEGYEQPELWNE